MEAKKYTRNEKIVYYAKMLANLEVTVRRNQDKIRFVKNRLAWLQSDEYQDWNSDLERELAQLERHPSEGTPGKIADNE